MKRFRPSVRRVISIVAAAFVGAALSLVFASPASAHTPKPTYVVVCNPNTSEWIIQWTIGLQSPQNATEWWLSDVSYSSPSTHSGIESDPTGLNKHAILPGPPKAPVPFTGTQTVPGTQTTASITVIASWTEGGTGTSGTVTKTAELGSWHCSPIATVVQTCDDMTITVTHPVAGQPAITGTFTQGNNAPTPWSAGPGQPFVKTFTGPAGFTVTWHADKNFVDQVFTWQPPDRCKTPTPSPTTPVTGASVTGTIGIGAGLVLAGAGLIALVFMMRRRRTVAGN